LLAASRTGTHRKQTHPTTMIASRDISPSL
jgi:hypothetical protein